MATLSRQTIDEDGVTVIYANAGGSGDVVTNTDGKTFLHLKNPGASTATVTITAQNTSKEVAGWGTLTKSDVVITLTTGTEQFAGPFAIDAFNNSSGQIALTYGGAGAADVDVAALILS